MSTRLSVRSSSAFIAGAVVALVIGTGTAYAANGGIFRLGRSNAATALTTLSNTHGSALQLKSKAGKPSLRVNRTAKVTDLNSDLLDGVDSTKFARVTTVGSVFGTGFVDDNETADPSDDAVIAVAVCPEGSQVVGGGGGDFTDDGTLYYSAPDGGDAWLVVSDTAGLNDTNAADVEAYARCWNPRADVASNLRTTSAKHAVSRAGHRAIQKAAARNQ
jgi:hypothetical protein